MPKGGSLLTVTDLFAGLGGSSTGLSQVPGLRVLMAANHWDLAMESHQANHPDTAHDCADISQVDPRRYPKTDILWASPECTNHSQARGRRKDLILEVDEFGRPLPNEAAERSRATMWDVPRFAERHQYRAVVVENVVDAVLWCPYASGTCGRCIANKTKGCGALFNAWLTAMDAIGYAHRLVFVNSMHAQATGLGAPQSRDRLYVVFWKHGDTPPDVDRLTRPPGVCPEHGPVQLVQRWKNPARQWGRYGKAHQYLYHCPHCNVPVEPHVLPADTAIDWSLPTRRYGDKPLSAKTEARIVEYLAKHDTPGALPLEGRTGKVVRPTSEPMRTLTCRREDGLIIPLRANNRLKPTHLYPFDTLCASGNHASLLQVTNEDLYECRFRMFENDEMKGAMGFHRGYIVKGTKREMQKLTGNAVCPPNARDIGTVIAEALAA
jgi:DNA (cytosine-5)-methyltransferase 1